MYPFPIRATAIDFARFVDRAFNIAVLAASVLGLQYISSKYYYALLGLAIASAMAVWLFLPETTYTTQDELEIAFSENTRRDRKYFERDLKRTRRAQRAQSSIEVRMRTNGGPAQDVDVFAAGANTHFQHRLVLGFRHHSYYNNTCTAQCPRYLCYSWNAEY